MASSRSACSSAVSRPSAMALLITVAARSRSASEARSRELSLKPCTSIRLLSGIRHAGATCLATGHWPGPGAGPGTGVPGGGPPGHSTEIPGEAGQPGRLLCSGIIRRRVRGTEVRCPEGRTMGHVEAAHLSHTLPDGRVLLDDVS